MPKRDATADVIDAVLGFAASSAVLAAGFVVPNALVVLEKPLNRYLKHLDEYAREREARRIISYMKSRGYIAGEYEFGLKITQRGRKRLQSAEFNSLTIAPQKRWDHIWRLVFYDIPEDHRYGRQTLTAKLRELGFFQLQQSVWIHPFPCRAVIEKVTNNFGLAPYVSYIKTNHLDNQKALIKRFAKRLPTTSFK